MKNLIRVTTRFLGRTPLHPQWFALYRKSSYLDQACRSLSGLVLDIGCADGKPANFLGGQATYVGLDYYKTAKDWYGTRPDVFGDAGALPLKDNSIDHCLMLDVLEHLPTPAQSLNQVKRILKPGGTLTIQVPFLYPVHDAPLDFHRWTTFGLRQAARAHGFRVDHEFAIGHPVETAALASNIADSKTVLNWINSRNPMALTVLVLPFIVLARNCLAWVLAMLSRNDDLMPYAYMTVWVKTDGDDSNT